MIDTSILTAAPLPFTVSEVLPEIKSLVTVSAADDATFDVVLGEAPAIVVVVAPGATEFVGSPIGLGAFVNDDLPFQTIVSCPKIWYCFLPVGIYE